MSPTLWCSAQALNQQNQHWVKLTARKEMHSLGFTGSHMKDAALVTCQHKTLIIINKLKIFHSQNSTKSRTLAVSVWSETYWFPAHWGLRWVLHQRSSWCWHLEDKQRWVSRGFVDYIIITPQNISEIITNRVWYHNVVKSGAVFGEWSHSGPHWAHSRYNKATDCTSLYLLVRGLTRAYAFLCTACLIQPTKPTL